MNRKITQLISILVLSLFAFNANAFSSYGVRGCGKLIGSIDTTAKEDKYNKDMTEMIVKAWIAGYITSYNSWLEVISKKENSDAIAKTDIDGVYMSVLNYCRANPLQNVLEAMSDTLNQLDPQKSKSKH